MVGRRTKAVLVGSLVAITACSSGTPTGGNDGVAIPGVGQSTASSAAITTDASGPSSTTPTDVTAAATTTSTVRPTTTNTTTTTTTSTTTTTPAPTTTTAPGSSTTSTTTVPPPPGVYDPACVVIIRPGDSLGLIAERFDDQTVTAASLQRENGIADPDLINAGSLLDVCVDNGLDDITGEERVDPAEAAANDPRTQVVIAQQTKLNELFAGYGIRPLLVDGISGPVTRQRLCAARVALGLPVSRADMEGGTLEEVALMFATSLPVPASSAQQTDRWALIDLTCQIMFVGQGAGSLSFVFPTSTGEAGYETRLQNRSRAFRYDPAFANGGWHNSTTFPVAIDNPLNGNMYRPIYFDGGQAIHGSNNVPTSPQSKGCVRLRLGDQDALVAWLGLGGRVTPTWSSNEINLAVNVQGVYVP